MTTIELTQKYNLPTTTTPEELSEHFRLLERGEYTCYKARILTYGDKVLVAAREYEGPGEANWYAASYDFTGEAERHVWDEEIILRSVSEERFEDEGHAIEWALRH